MNEKTKQAGRKELDAWIKKNLNAAVHKLMARGNIDSLVVEGKAAWVLPFQVLIGKIRAKDQLILSGLFVVNYPPIILSLLWQKHREKSPAIFP